MALEAHIVTHTHWDREWYHPAERFRQRLVALIDELIDDPPAPEESFLLDGQAIIIEDYLDVRPDRANALTALLRDGRLEAGPWYVLADELIPSGEALIRNLLAGRRVLRRHQAESPPVLYCPDSFGHPGTLPALAKGFGLPLIVLWRGYGGARSPAGDTVRWLAPDGEDVVLFHLPPSGYEFGSHLPADDAGARLRWERMRAELVPRSTTGVMLIPNGADHHARQLRFRDAIAALERAGGPDNVHRSSLRQFAEQLLARSATQKLPVVRGELRDSYGYTWTLQGTFATRAHEKRLNARAERLLIREAEPWAALAALHGVSRAPLVQRAWRTLLSAHPHDTLCGCSIDEVALAMEGRLRSAANQAIGIRDDAIADLLGHDPALARDHHDQWTPTVVVRNPAPRGRSGVAILEIEEWVDDVPVGPGSASTGSTAAALPARKPRLSGLSAPQVLTRSLRHARIESPRHYPDNDLVAVTRVAAWIPDSLPYGMTSYALGSAGPDAPSGPERRVTADRRSLRNGRMIVQVSKSGTVSIDDLGSRRTIQSLIELVDETDVGDLYTPAPRARPSTVVFRGVRLMHRGPLRGELALRFRISDPAAPGRKRDADLMIRLVLDADAPFLRVAVSGENRGEQRRIRLVFRSDIAGGAVWADAAFGAVLRQPIALDESEAAMERAPRTAPLHRYVSLYNQNAGCTVFSDGLAEYEAGDDGTVAITLLRAVGELSRNDLPERPGHAGWPAPTPGAQCIGEFAAAFAILLHGPRLAPAIDLVERCADDVLNPMTGATLRSALRIPERVKGVALTGSGLAFSALKQSEDGRWLVLRCVNLRDEQVDGRWELPFEARELCVARLDESVLRQLEPAGLDIEFRAPPRGIVTMLAR
jgi:mannosylglycerate hydrolase